MVGLSYPIYYNHLILIRYQIILLLLLIEIFICIVIRIKLPLPRFLRIFVLIILLIYSTFPNCQLLIVVIFILVIILIITLLQLIKFYLLVALSRNVVICHRRIRKLSILNKILVLLIDMFLQLRKTKEISCWINGFSIKKTRNEPCWHFLVTMKCLKEYDWLIIRKVLLPLVKAINAKTVLDHTRINLSSLEMVITKFYYILILLIKLLMEMYPIEIIFLMIVCIFLRV